MTLFPMRLWHWGHLCEHIRVITTPNQSKHVHAAVRNFHPARLEAHQPARELVVPRLADLAHDLRVEYGHAQALDEERTDVLRGDQRGQQLQCFDGVKPGAVAADEIERWCQQVRRQLHRRTEIYPKEGEEDVVGF